MTQEEILRELASLPPEGQQQVADFIAQLRERYTRSQPADSAHLDIAQEGFIGMWADREDLRESNAWVRDLREREWARQGD